MTAPIVPQPYRRLGWIAFALLFTAWSAGLVMPVPGSVVEEIGDKLAYLLAKSLHMGVFAAEAFLVLLLPLTTAFRWKMLAVVSGQAFASEGLQYALRAYCNRNGNWFDVMLDHLGIFAGCVVYAIVCLIVGRVFVPAGEKATLTRPVSSNNGREP
jgi:hypothetical protein